MATKTTIWSAEVTAEAKATWTAWTTEKAWEGLGIKAKTALKPADKNGEGGTRAAMCAVLWVGYKDQAHASQVVACIRHTFLKCKATNTSGITLGWFAVQHQLETVASNAVVRTAKDGTVQLVVKSRVKVVEKKAAKPKALPSANGPVVVVRPSDKALAEAKGGAA